MQLTLPTITLILFSALVLRAATPAKQPAPDKPGPAAAAGSKADQAWEDVVQSGEPPRPPEEWRNAQPTPEQIEKFKAQEAERLFKAAGKALAFQAQFPGDARLEEARSKEYELLQIAAQLGNTNAFTRLDTIDQAKLADPNTSEEERFHIRATGVNRKAMSRLAESRTAAFEELEKGARALLKEFPKRSEGYEMLMAVASEAEPDKARQLAKELVGSPAPDQVKEAAKAVLKKMDLVGKPLAIKFTAVDGRPVDLAKLRGKVVLIDFWATWCGPCVREVPSLVATYDKLHPKGFEIVGISFDQKNDKDKLLSFVKEHKMPWPQYFDGKFWENDYGKQFGIQSIPTLWLVDKKGILRDLNAREDLAAKVEKLLAEKL